MTDEHQTEESVGVPAAELERTFDELERAADAALETALKSMGILERELETSGEQLDALTIETEQALDALDKATRG